MTDKPFLTDIKTLRERARQHIENGAITEGYSADRVIANVEAGKMPALPASALPAQLDIVSSRLPRSSACSSSIARIPSNMRRVVGSSVLT